jgi:hypothetical protein
MIRRIVSLHPEAIAEGREARLWYPHEDAVHDAERERSKGEVADLSLDPPGAQLIALGEAAAQERVDSRQGIPQATSCPRRSRLSGRSDCKGTTRMRVRWMS